MGRQKGLVKELIAEKLMEALDSNLTKGSGG